MLDLTASTEGMSAKEFMACMADLSSNEKKVLLPLPLVVEACNKCVDYAERILLLVKENDKVAEHNTDLVVLWIKRKSLT